MDTMTLIARATDAGLILTADGDKLSITGPKSPASAAIVKELAANKASVLAWLTIEPDIVPVSPIGDLTTYSRQIVEAGTWEALQAECQRRYSGRWTMLAEPVGNDYYVQGIHCLPK